MAQASRIFRTFICSTFAELKQERNAGQEDICPRLRDVHLQHDAHFQALDLRRELGGKLRLTSRRCPITPSTELLGPSL